MKVRKIIEVADSLKIDIDSFQHISCEVNRDTIKGITLYGYTKRNSNGTFFKDSCIFRSALITKISFKKEKSQSRLRTRSITRFEFKDKIDLRKFEKFHSSMGRKMSHTKQAFDFFKKDSEWYLYYAGYAR